MGGGDVLPEYGPVSSHGEPIYINISSEVSYFYRRSVRNKSLFSGVLNESASTKMTVGTVWSFHGFSETSCLHR